MRTNHHLPGINIFSILLLLSLSFLSISCSPSFTDKSNTGDLETPSAGLPFIKVVTSSNVTEEGDTQALIFYSILENSLIFKDQQDSLVSRVEVEVQILDSQNTSKVNKLYQMLFGKDLNSNYYDQNTFHKQLVYDLPPGEYQVKVAITDLHSGKQSLNTSKLTIPDPYAEAAFISNIRFYKKPTPEENFIAVNGYNINAGFDSLKFNFQVTNGQEDVPLDIESKLLRFEADTDPAHSMSGRDHRSTSIEYVGLNYRETELIQSSIRRLTTSSSVTIENSFTDLPKGNYRFEVSVKTEDEQTFYEVRDFSIKSKNYPQIKTARELARPLVYLMTQNEYNELLQIKDADSLKSAIDTYWLRNIKNATKAKTIIELYYDRVEQANIQFGNYKEGWKTDPGMIYILFGPPLYTDQGFGEMTWFYNFDSSSSNPSIYFEDTQFGNTQFPFENFVLQRDSRLYSLEYRQIQSWLDGSILFLSQ